MNQRSKEMRDRLAEVERELGRLKKQRKMLEKGLSRDRAGDWDDIPAPPPAAVKPAQPAPPAETPEREAGPVDGSRERFASYFMTGGLGRSGPQLRRERRAMRNKAIVAALAAAILVYALVHFLVN